MKCRHCKHALNSVFLDLGHAPPSNAYVNVNNLRDPEVYYPLKVFVCDQCWLVQTEDYAKADDLFNSGYAYFSSISKGWLDHARAYVEMIIDRLSLDEESYVIEVASNDGYLLKNFVKARIPCLGIEPTDSTASAAESLGIPVIREFFGLKLARNLSASGKKADLVLGNNVYAHVPDINDFTRGLKTILKDHGTITLEFPHLLQLIQNNQFDTIYHEHFSYLSVLAVKRIFSDAGLNIYDVEEIPTHGGSLRIYGCHDNCERVVADSVRKLMEKELSFGLDRIETYTNFQVNAIYVKNDFLRFLIETRNSGKRIVGYGAAAKGNTLLNFAGVKPDLLPIIFDAAPSKQGKYMPGSLIPIAPPSEICKYEPDYVLIFPWNIADEVIGQIKPLLGEGVKFLVAVPELKEVK